MFQIDFKSNKSIYAQVMDSFKGLINSGMLKPGEPVSSVRDLAIALTVNPNTINRAYLELENQGFFHTEQGKDWFIASNTKKSGTYGRMHANLRELLLKGEEMASIGRLVVMEEKPYIHIKNLAKYFDEYIVLENFNMKIIKGSIYGLAGVNGSGKTTVVKHLAGLYRPDEGFVKIDDMDAYNNAHKKTIGYMPEEMYFLPQYTMNMMSKFFAGKYGENWNQRRYQQLMELFGLDEGQKVSSFSSGMQKQVGFIFAISSMPDVLLLDETIDGLDPIVRRHVLRQIIEDVANRQMTVLITSHNMKELDNICDTVGIIHKGSMVIEQDLDELKANLHKIHVSFRPDFSNGISPYEGLEVLYKEEMGIADILVVRGNEDEITRHINSFNPLVYYHLPITLEEIFIYERSGDNDDDN